MDGLYPFRVDIKYAVLVQSTLSGQQNQLHQFFQILQVVRLAHFGIPIAKFTASLEKSHWTFSIPNTLKFNPPGVRKDNELAISLPKDIFKFV